MTGDGGSLSLLSSTAGRGRLILLSNILIFAIYVLVTCAVGIAAWMTKSEFVLSLLNGLIAGLLPLICINLILEQALETKKAPAVAVANRDASRVLGEARKFVFDLYGATARSGRLTLEVHRSFNSRLDARMAPLLAATPLRAIGVNEPDRPAIVYMFQDALAIQQAANQTLMAHGQYLDPAVVAALYDVSNANLVSFVISAVNLNAVPERLESDVFTDYIAKVANLEAALNAADPKINHRGALGIMQLLEQPGIIPRPVKDHAQTH